MLKNFRTTLKLNALVFGLQTPKKETDKGSFEFGYSSLAAFGQYSGNIPKETFHTTSFFKETFLLYSLMNLIISLM